MNTDKTQYIVSYIFCCCCCCFNSFVGWLDRKWSKGCTSSRLLSQNKHWDGWSWVM